MSLVLHILFSSLRQVSAAHGPSSGDFFLFWGRPLHCSLAHRAPIHVNVYYYLMTRMLSLHSFAAIVLQYIMYISMISINTFMIFYHVFIYQILLFCVLTFLCVVCLLCMSLVRSSCILTTVWLFLLF